MSTTSLNQVDFTQIYGLDSGSVNKQQRAYNFLKEAIVSGKYMPEKPLVERDLCEQLDISRTPLREALRRLNTEGLVESYPSKGVCVVGVTLEKANEVHELKEAIESMAARLCCERITKKELADLEEKIQIQKELNDKGDIRNAIDYDMLFHVNLLYGAHSEMIEEQGKALMWQTRRYAQLMAYDRTYGDVFVVEHEKIYQAIVNRDAAAAEQEVHDHISTIKSFQAERWHMLFGGNE